MIQKPGKPSGYSSVTLSFPFFYYSTIMKSNYSDWPQKNAKISKKKPETMYFVLILTASFVLSWLTDFYLNLSVSIRG